jgi:glycosyltransferase involved in cell wall biosynthesis
MIQCRSITQLQDKMMPNIVYFFDKVFWPQREGCHHLVAKHVQYLAGSGLAFTVILLVQPHEEALVPSFLKHFSNVDIRTIRVSEMSERLASRYLALKKEHTFHSRLEANRVAVLHARLQEELARADIFFTNYFHTVPFLMNLPRYCVSIVETHDLQSSWQICMLHGSNPRFGEFGPPEGQALYKRLLDEEMALLDLFDFVIAIAGDEAETMARHLPDGKVTYLPPVLLQQSRTIGHSEPKYDLLFVGGHHAPNLKSIQQFYRETFVPFLKRRGVKLALAGKVGPLSGIDDEDVIKLGIVENVADVYGMARVVICPISHGTGCNIKVVEALTYGKAVVATPQALRGLNVDSSRLLVASDSETFARHIMMLLNDPAMLRHYQNQSIELIRVGHSPQRYDRLMGGIMSRALSKLEVRLGSAIAQTTAARKPNNSTKRSRLRIES